MTDINDIFTPKPAADITADLIEWVRGGTDKLSDFNVGSVVRTLLEAHADELDDYYQAIYYGLLKAIPTAIYIGFGFDVQPATAASGYVVFTRLGELGLPLDIPAGTPLIANSGARFLTQSAVTMPAGDAYATVLARAETAGAAGNIPARTLALANSNFGDILTVTNPLSLSGGVDAETDDHRAERFAAFIRALARGTLAAVQYAAGIPVITDAEGVVIERVQRQSVFEEPGHVMLYIDNGAWGISGELLAKVQQTVDGYRDPDTLQWIGGYRPAGMRVEVAPMARQAFDVALEIRPTALADVDAVELAVRARLETFLAGVAPLQTIRMIDLINVALPVAGVREVVVLAPSANVTVSANTVVYLRNLDITWIG